MQTPLTNGRLTALKSQINFLDETINRLQRILNAASFVNVTLMVSGRHRHRVDEFHEMLAWKRDLPFPEGLAREFLNHYCADLIARRLNLIEILEKGIEPFQDETTYHRCQCCARETMHRNYLTIPGQDAFYVPAGKNVWICNECENVVKLHAAGGAGL